MTRMRLVWMMTLAALLATGCSGSEQAAGASPIVVLGANDSSEVTIHPSGGGEPLTVMFDGPAASGLLTYRQNVLVVASVGGAPHFSLVDTSTGQATQITSTQSFPQLDQPALESQWLSLTTDRRDSSPWTVVNLSNGETLSPTDQNPEFFPAFSGDGTKLLYTATDFHSILVELSDGATTDLGRRDPIVSLSPSGATFATQDLWVEAVSVATGKAVRIDNAQTVVGWLDDDTLVVRTGSDEFGLVDARTGTLTVVEGDASSPIRGGQLMVDGDSGVDGVLRFTDLLTGEVTTEDVPQNSPVFRARFTTDRYVWGFAGGVNGSTETLGGWALDRQSGAVTTFEQPLSDGELYADQDNGYNSDWSAVIMSDSAGGLYVARVGEELVRLPTDRSTRGTFCPDGSIVVFTPNSDVPAQLLSSESYDVVDEFEPADWAMCAAES